jgi:esterase
MVRLHHEFIASDAPPPRQWLVLTHGIFGAGSNWRSIARKLHRARPEFGCVLVDLRNHGRSEVGPSPNDLAACADDLGALIDELAAAGSSVTAVAGHSFGGKVVAMLRQRREEHSHSGSIQQWWLLDSSPSPRPAAWTEPGNTVREVLEVLESLPETFATRDRFETAITAAGHARSLAQWLALNLEAGSDGALRLRLRLPEIREMLHHYYATDLWPALRDPTGGEVHVVVAQRSTAISQEDRAALEGAPAHIHQHLIDAGHWLHIDAPDAVVALLAKLAR